MAQSTATIEQFVCLGLLKKHGDNFHVRGPGVYLDKTKHFKLIKTIQFVM